MADNYITEVRLINVPLENDYKHTLYFASKSAQTSYFTGLSCSKKTDFSYQRKDHYIRYPECYDDLLKYNYVMYKNSAFGSKWFYAFITDMKFVDEGRTDIFIETDVMQTWMFDITIKPSFVEREHVSDDTIGAHTVPEQLELGDYTIQGAGYDDNLTSNLLIIVGATIDITTAMGTGDDAMSSSVKCDNIAGGVYGGVFSGVKYFAFDSADPSQVSLMLSNVAKKGQSDGIVSMFMFPQAFLNIGDNGVVYSSRIDPIEWSPNGLKNISAINQLDGYAPKNNKLLTYPYCFLLISNNAGASAVYHYEHFSIPSSVGSNLKCYFEISGVLTPGGSIRLRPMYYKKAPANNDYGLTAGKLPICNWNTDVYTNWLTQNGVNIAISGLSSVGQVVAGATLSMTGAGALAGAGMIASGLSGVASTVGEVYAHSYTPPQAEGNLNSGDVNFADKMLTFSYHHVCIKEEFARIIDDFFNMFGYKVNSVKVPNKDHRTNYWYTKTIDVNIDGAIPMNDMKKIKECYNNGITFWKNATYIQDYSVSNLIT